MGKYVKHRGQRVGNAKAGEALALGDIVCINTSGNYVKADATTADGLFPAVGVVTIGCANNGYPEVCSTGVIANAGSNLTIGKSVYLSTTAGEITQTAPPTGNKVQVIGVAVNATDVAYSFDKTLVNGID